MKCRKCIQMDLIYWSSIFIYIYVTLCYCSKQIFIVMLHFDRLRTYMLKNYLKSYQKLVYHSFQQILTEKFGFYSMKYIYIFLILNGITSTCNKLSQNRLCDQITTTSGGN